MFIHKTIRLCLTLVMVLSIALSASPIRIAQANTVCVNPGGTDGCYATIQAAINAAIAGDTINVAAGTYGGQINVNKSVTLIGDPGDASVGLGPNAPVIDGGSVPGDAFLIANGVSNVTIQGFEMRNFTSPDLDGIGNGISAWVGSTSNITVQDNYFHDLGYNAVLVGNDWNSNPSKWGDHTNWLIKGNVIEGFGYIGLELTNTSNSSIEDNVIHMTTPYIGAIFSSARRSESGLTVKHNLIDGSPSTAFPVVYMYAYDLDMPNPNLDGVLIEGNTIATSGTPFQIYIRNIGTGTVTGVQVHDNSLSTLKTNTPALIDATNNWWGAASGPVAGAVIGNVDYTPWCTDAACTIASLAFNPTSATIDVLGSTTVYIDLATVVNLYGYQFQVAYDSSKVSAVGTFVNSFFDTATPGQSFITWNADCVTTPGVCKFAISKQAPDGLPISGSGTLAQITFTGVSSGIVPLMFSSGSDILADRDGNALSHTLGTAMLTVNGSATVSGVVNLQGRAVSGGTVILTTAGFGPTTAIIAANGAWSATVPVAPAGSTYQLDATHSLYLDNQLTGVALTPGGSYTAATTKLLGGDADNSGLIDLSDLSCIGGVFGGGVAICGSDGSSDINGDGSTNILDLVLAGGNFELFTPRGW